MTRTGLIIVKEILYYVVDKISNLIYIADKMVIFSLLYTLSIYDPIKINPIANVYGIIFIAYLIKVIWSEVRYDKR